MVHLDFVSVNEAELLALRMALCQANHLGLSNLIAEGYSSYAIRWASGSSRPPWRLTDIAEEVVDLGLKLNISFVLIKRSVNEVADHLAK